MKIKIGIDPGVKTGFAIYSPDVVRLVDLRTTDFWGAIRLLGLYGPEDNEVVIERPNNNGTKTNALWSGGGLKGAFNVGGVIREADLLVEWCTRNGYNVNMMHPQGKIDAKRFKLITGWQGRTNEHDRDAAMLVWGR